MKLRSILSTLAVCVSALFMTNVQASPIVYEVSSTGKINCAGAPHGLWTSNLKLGGGCGAYYDYQSGSTLTVDTMTGNANLSATAINPNGYRAEINFGWTDLVKAEDYTGMVKNPGLGDASTWLFFTSGSGAVDFYQGNTLLGTVALTLIPDTALQVGWGANDKTTAFGASSWLRPPTGKLGNNWDFNMELKAGVPEPSTLVLLLLGTAGLIARRRMGANI